MKYQSGLSPVIFGEVLFDCFPDGSRVLGGAPFNVAWHLQAFGQAPLFVSALGDDDAGQQVLDSMRTWGMDTSGVQIYPEHPTGKVNVSFNQGEPEYAITTPCAYDFITAESIPRLPGSSLLYHGSLAARNAVSRQTLKRLKSSAETCYCDINLRPPFWKAEQRVVCLADIQVLKLNADELANLADRPADSDDLTTFTGVLEQFNLERLIVTRGSDGALALDRHSSELVRVELEQQLSVVDTVGAGDAFSSICMLGICQGWPLAQTLQRAQEFASAIVGVRGATVSEHDFYQNFIKQWSS